MSQAYRYRLGFCFIVDEMTNPSTPTKPPMLYSTLFLTVIATNSMKKIILFIALGLFSPRCAKFATSHFEFGSLQLPAVGE
jgi:hypothetical protein